MDDHRARQRHALLLAAGKLGGLTVAVFGNSHQLQAPSLTRIFQLRALDLARLQAVGHVFPDAQVREQAVLLEHHADVAAVCGNVVDHLVVEVDVALVDGVEARDHAQKRGLAAAGRSQQGEELAGLDLQVYAVYRAHIVVIDFGRGSDLDRLAHAKQLL